MKLRAAFLHVAALLALAGSTLGDGDATSPTVCTVKEDEHNTLFQTLALSAWDCVVTDGRGIEELKETKSLDERKTFFKGVCDKRGRIRECLAGVGRQSEACQDRRENALFGIVRELLETALDGGCVRDGDAIATAATLYVEASSGDPLASDPLASDPFVSDPFLDCVSAGLGRVTSSASRDFQSQLYFLYRGAINVRECFASAAHGERADLSREMEAIVGGVVARMKCLHPRDETAVTCASVDVASPDPPGLCPIRSHDDKTTYDVLLERFSVCLSSGYYEEETGVTRIESLDSSLAFMQQFCGRTAVVGRCWSDAVSLSKACLEDRAQRDVVETLEDSLRHAVDYGCVDSGRSVALVLFRVMAEARKSPERLIVKECLVVAKQMHPAAVGQFDAARMLTYHRQLKTLKGCLLEKLRGYDVAVFSAETVLTLIQTSMKCVDPGLGVVTPCETLDATPPTSAGVCPFVGDGDDDDEPPKFDAFVDMGVACVRASAPELDRADDLSTAEEYRTVFAAFCRRRSGVKRCVDDVSAHSATCLDPTQHQMFGIFADFLESALEAGCGRDGGVLATIAHTLDENDKGGANNTKEREMEVCLEAAGGQAKAATLAAMSLSAKSMHLYRTLDSLKECVMNVDFEPDVKTVLGTFVNDILRSFKCIHPDNGTSVLCESIVNNLT